MGNPQRSQVCTTLERSTTSFSERKPETAETGVFKVCRVCMTAKPQSEFYFRTDSGKQRRECKACMIVRNRERNTGCTQDMYDELLDRQNGRCAICLSKPKQSLHADHCHKTGRVRGLLCSNCNTGLGLFRDKSTLLVKAIKYLEEDIV